VKTVRTFNHIANDASLSKIDYKFLIKLCAVDGGNKKTSSKIHQVRWKCLFKKYENRL